MIIYIYITIRPLLYFLMHLTGCDHSQSGYAGVGFCLKDVQGGSFHKFFKGVKVNISTGK